MRHCEKAPDRAAQRAAIQDDLGPHPRHVHPRAKRLTGNALRRAVREREETLSSRSLELEKRQMAEGRVRHPSAEANVWLWDRIMAALGWTKIEEAA